MPQLNPNPWFLIMASSWLIFLLIMQPKLASFNPTNPPSNKTQSTKQPLPWSWPWT
uniref:ATP synthase complex subunit 8 n=1 Tax=Eudromia elegans TaxID=8805 RepID=Q9B6T0_EUDEL|nr:ATP synthase F0 subunit 8 [Eudromia elegans]AAK08593.1 ATPase subunit 8 [Eudromia elegans]AAK53291.1 ATPase 8 [Eudromia elegans]QNS38478.1 ATP synthase F0 subunit 8 [Eudromia elegans]